LIKTNAKDLFFKAALCYLANEDLVGAKRAINNYKIDDPHFDDSRELEFLAVSV
jgi:alpha-soluble NSF attachment protein